MVKRHTLGYDGTAHVPIEALRRHIPDDLAAPTSRRYWPAGPPSPGGPWWPQTSR
ncbi:exonuclease V subunit beta [Mycobacterium tuberculosis RGTB327]|nr:exonuclease V subunit beta [Mycobacterium tuberculosis RGTB327]